MMQPAVSHLLVPPHKAHPAHPIAVGLREIQRRPAKEAQNGHEVPVEMLKDAQVLALSYSYMPLDQQEELSDLLADQREGVITSAGRERLEELMQISRRGLLRKAEALKVAVERGLRAPLGSYSNP